MPVVAPLSSSRYTQNPVPAWPHFPRPGGEPQQAALPSLGQILLDHEAISSADLFKALVTPREPHVPLSDTLLAHGWVTEAAMARAFAIQWNTSVVDLSSSPPDARLVDMVGAGRCLTLGIVPWRRAGGATFIATARPQDFGDQLDWLRARFGPVRMVVCEAGATREAVLAIRAAQLARRAENCVPAAFSCRTRNEVRLGGIALALMAVLAEGLWAAPVVVLAALTGLAIITLLATTILKALAFRATLARDTETQRRPPAASDAPLPFVSLMVPMFREEDIADRLIGRIARLDYPRELMECLLVIEESDAVTRTALQGVKLPFWMRVVTVPDGPIRTKPRAMNYAMNLCRGEIIGVWDAEDRPETDQLRRVAAHFARDPDVACLQGALDFYNPEKNWLARCFTVEYSSWFRGVLPGMARMGLIVPLGGTTFFIRRKAVEAAGGWDGWNVTEDADLGARLARMGLRTEIVATTTHEEANCRPVPWVKQRSRWLKGFAMTWGVHMRDPVRLWRDVGPARFIGFHLQMFATVQQLLLAPLLWSFWLMTFGLPHPLGAMMFPWMRVLTFGLFILSEALNVVIGIWAVRRTHPKLIPWVPTLYAYFPLACLSAWKAVYEIVAKPFYWDKTAHGAFHSSDDPDAAAPVPELLVPVTGTIGEAVRVTVH